MIGPRREGRHERGGRDVRRVEHVGHVKRVSEGVRGILKAGTARAAHVLTLQWAAILNLAIYFRSACSSTINREPLPSRACGRFVRGVEGLNYAPIKYLIAS